MPDVSFTLMRTSQSGGCTLGTLTADAGDFSCFTLEPAPTALHPDIPPGRYEVRMVWSVKFHRQVPMLVNVPGRSAVEIHPGNEASDTEGCILLGLQQTPTKVLQSREAVHGFVVKVYDGLHDPNARVWLKILPAPAPIPPSPPAAIDA